MTECGSELILFVDEIVCTLLQRLHAKRDGLKPAQVCFRQEVRTGERAYADFVVEPAGLPRYVLEVDYGYSARRIAESVRRKYSEPREWFGDVSRMLLVTGGVDLPDQGPVAAAVRESIPRHWDLEIWDQPTVCAHVREQIGVELDDRDPFPPAKLVEIRTVLDRELGLRAFGEHYAATPLDSALLWHFGADRLAELFDRAGREKRSVLAPRTYSDVAVVFCDLSGFSGYVRDTPDDRTIQDCLNLFSTKARFQVLNDGGMVYQFLGDAIIGFFGVPAGGEDAADQAFRCSQALLGLGESVSNEWQRRLDRVQPVSGCHVGIALGDIQILPLRPFSRTHIGAVGDTINLAARLCSHATEGQIVVSNRVWQNLSWGYQKLLRAEEKPVEAKNVGLIRAWTYSSRPGGGGAPRPGVGASLP
jgi:class 3 adenylate cyclase